MKARVDANQKEIVNILRRCGYSVAITSQLGKGFPDLVVGTHKLNFLFEIKDGSKPKSQQKLTKDEEKFKESWRGNYYVITSADDAINIINTTLFNLVS